MKVHKLESAGQLPLGFSVEEMTPCPRSDWVVPDPSTWPDRLAGNVGVDLECNDIGLRDDQGPGWAWRGGGNVCGYAIAADNFRGYLPVAHLGGGNVDPDQARRWLNHVLSDENQMKVFANAMYDIAWAKVDGVIIRGPTIDVQLVEALIDEYRIQFALDGLARDRLGRRKDETLLEAAAAAHRYHPKEDLHKLHAKYVGPYAEEDASLPREIWEKQRKIVDDEDLHQIMQLEHDLLPMYMEMRERGVRIDVRKVEQLRDRLNREVAEEVAEVKRLTGTAVSIWEPASVAKMLDDLDIPYDLTRTGKPSIKNKVLEESKNPAAQCVFRAREKSKLVGTFLVGQILNQLHGDRVHGQIHPLKSDDGGTVSGRLSMSNPNLQFIPARTEEGQLIRTCFIPEDGELWGSDDMSQQEVRLLTHFAVKTHNYDRSIGRGGIPSALVAMTKYIEDPSLNYHKFVAEMTELPYKAAKILNFAIIYGRGIKETAKDLGTDYDGAKALFDQHAKKMPFARAMSRRTQDVVVDRGYIRTLLNRRQRFPLYEPQDWDLRDGTMLRLDEAKKRWPDVELTRARIHKALNALIQSSAADQMKKAMLDVWRAGLSQFVRIQVHDELDMSIPDEKIAYEIADIMRDAVKLEVPVLVDVSIGSNWGDLH